MLCKSTNYIVYLLYSISFNSIFINFKSNITKNINSSSLIMRGDYTTHKVKLPNMLI